MGKLSDAVVNNILDVYFGDGTVSAPSNYYIGLSVTTPSNNTGSGVTEPSTGDYARVQVPNTAAYWNNAVARNKSNAQVVTFPTATDSWGTVTHFVIYDSLTGGNFIGWGELSASQAIASGGVAEFPEDSIVIEAPGA